jgi:hypothetical protein
MFSGSGPQKCSQIQRSAAVHASFNKDWWVQRRLLVLSSVIKIQYWIEGPKIDEQRCCGRSCKKGTVRVIILWVVNKFTLFVL